MLNVNSITFHKAFMVFSNKCMQSLRINLLKFTVKRGSFLETIVAKQSKHMDFFRWQKDECKPERKISVSVISYIFT